MFIIIYFFYFFINLIIFLYFYSYGPGHYKSSLLGGKKTSASEERSLYIQSDVTYPDDEICLEFNTAGDREKWFEVVTALLLASSSCPHYLQSL